VQHVPQADLQILVVEPRIPRARAPGLSSSPPTSPTAQSSMSRARAFTSGLLTAPAGESST